jgi:hypothetical protein
MVASGGERIDSPLLAYVDDRNCNDMVRANNLK